MASSLLTCSTAIGEILYLVRFLKGKQRIDEVGSRGACTVLRLVSTVLLQQHCLTSLHLSSRLVQASLSLNTVVLMPCQCSLLLVASLCYHRPIMLLQTRRWIHRLRTRPPRNGSQISTPERLDFRPQSLFNMDRFT